VIGHRVMLTPDAVLRGETVDDVLERVVGRIKPPLGVDRSDDANGSANGSSRRRRARAETAGAR
jgi:hypothetical protein